MAAEILATGTTAANSADVTVLAGASLAVALKDGDAADGVSFDARVRILLKDDAGAYWAFDELGGRKTATVLVAAGVYRFARVAGASCGVFSG